MSHIASFLLYACVTDNENINDVIHEERDIGTVREDDINVGFGHWIKKQLMMKLKLLKNLVYLYLH